MRNRLFLKKKNLYSLCCILFFVIIYLLVPFSTRRDVVNYIYQYNHLTFSQGIGYHGPLYMLIIEALRALGAPVLVFFITILVLSLYFKFKAIWFSSEFYFFSIILYGFLIFPIQELITIEAGLAIAFFLFSVSDVAEKKLISYFFKIACAIFIHYSALIFLPLYFLSAKKMNKLFYLFILFLALFFSIFSSNFINIISYIMQFLPEVYANKSAMYISGEALGTTNIFNFHYTFLYLSAILITSISDRFVRKIDIICAKIYIIGVSVFYILSFVPAFAFRFSEMLTTVLVILFPNMLKYFKPSSRIILVIIILTFSLINLYPTLKLYNF